MANILVTGGAGFIGSHTCIELLKADHAVVIVDNLSNSKKASIDTVERLTAKKVTFYNEDICNEQALENIFSKEQIDSVVHFAGLKSVGESSEKPLSYYENNVVGTLTLLKVMTKYNCRNLIFSSSATVYGNPEKVPIKEEFPLSVTNPYGRTKLILEDILKDIFTADHSWNIIVLRYFNPIGAHESGDLGEDPFGIPNNLLPYVTQVAIGKLAYVNVFGSDYPTKDGTGVRDYIHVVDLARGHVAALSQMMKPGIFRVYNLGTGKGYSVLDIIETMSDVIGRDIPYKISKRRPGDIAICYADPSKANLELGWQARYDIKQMCQDAWRWQKKHPNGFDV